MASATHLNPSLSVALAYRIIKTLYSKTIQTVNFRNNNNFEQQICFFNPLLNSFSKVAQTYPIFVFKSLCKSDVPLEGSILYSDFIDDHKSIILRGYGSKNNSVEIYNDFIYKLNAFLVYLFQVISSATVRSQTKKFLSLINHRNQALRQSIPGYPDENVQFIQLSFVHKEEIINTMHSKINDQITTPQTGLSMSEKEIGSFRETMLTHLRNYAKDQKWVHNIHYFWKVRYIQNKLTFELYLVSEKSNSDFQANTNKWANKLLDYLNEFWKSDNISYHPLQIDGNIDTARTVYNLLSYKPIDLNEPQSKKSTFGHGKVGNKNLISTTLSSTW